MHKISFIIVHYNTYELTKACIESIVSAPIDAAEIEIIVVDNSSTEKIPQPFDTLSPVVHYFRNEENVGFAKGNNMGISNSTGDFICLINSDARLKTVDFSSLIKTAQKDNVGFVTTRLIFDSGKIQNNCQSFPNAAKMILEKLRVHKFMPSSMRSRVFQGAYFNHDQSAYTDWAWGAFLFFEKSLLANFNERKLDDRYFMYAEDLLWGYLMRKKGLRTWYSASDVVIHDMGMSKGDRNSHLRANVNDFISSYYPRWHGWLLLSLGRKWIG